MVTLPTIFTMPPAPRSLFSGFSLSSLAALLWYYMPPPGYYMPWRMQHANRGRRPLTFLDTVARDAGLDVGDVRTVMLDRAVWRQILDGISIEDRPK